MTLDLTVRGTLVLPEGPLDGAWLGVRDGKIAAIGTGSTLSHLRS